MKIISTSALTLLIIFILAISAKAQKGDYVITTKGDTIACTISAPMLGAMKYKINKTDSTEKPKKISVKDIKEFYTAKKDIWGRRVYVHAYDTLYAVYLSVIESGRINLYQEITNNSGPYGYTSSTQWYIAKGSDTTKILKTSSLSIFMRSKGKRKNDFAEMLSDNKNVYDEFLKTTDFSFGTIRNFVHLYNTGYPATDEKSRPNY